MSLCGSWLSAALYQSKQVTEQPKLKEDDRHCTFDERECKELTTIVNSLQSALWPQISNI